jgi:hypothetical protein
MTREMRRVLLTSKFHLRETAIRTVELISSIDCKSTFPPSPDKTIPLPLQTGEPGNSPILAPSRPVANADISSDSPHQDFGAPSAAGSSPEPPQIDVPIKSERESPYPGPLEQRFVAVTTPFMPTRSSIVNEPRPSISAKATKMVDNSDYSGANAKSPLAPHKPMLNNMQQSRQVKASASSVPLTSATNRHQQRSNQTKPPTVIKSASHARTMSTAAETQSWRDNIVPEGPIVTEVYRQDGWPEDTELSSRNDLAHSFLHATEALRTRHSVPEATQSATNANANSSTPRSLYSSPSTTKHASDLLNSDTPRKRSRTARSDHPERFMYSGNTFSNFNNHSFLNTARDNPYLSSILPESSRPVYSGPKEARKALKDANKPLPPPVLDYHEQIKEMTSTLTSFRKKHKKYETMTEQAGIVVEGGLWDRLVNLVQYPPDFQHYARATEGDMARYAEKMSEWDKAMGHQVIIKKRIVYREAVEKLQERLQILRTERALDTNNRVLKRKAAEAEVDEDDADVQNVGGAGR